MAEVIVLYKCTGLNNVVDPVRLQYDSKAGVSELSAAVNVDIDETGRVSRRKGYSLLRNDSNCHSLWSAGEDCFYVSGESLYRLNRDWTRVGIRSGLTPGLRVSFCKPFDKVYYSNGVENGYILRNVSYTWVGEPYVGPTTVWQISTVPPLGHILEVFGSYLLIAQENILWYSLPFAFGWYVLSRDRVEFEGRITMVKGLDSGVWVSDLTGTYWLEGQLPEKWIRDKKSTSFAIEGTGTLTSTDIVGSEKGGVEQCVLWSSESGVHLGMDKGELVNLTVDKLHFSPAMRGSGIVFNKRYVTVFD
jgi:hypothetical protein